MHALFQPTLKTLSSRQTGWRGFMSDRRGPISLDVSKGTVGLVRAVLKELDAQLCRRQWPLETAGERTVIVAHGQKFSIAFWERRTRVAVSESMKRKEPWAAIIGYGEEPTGVLKFTVKLAAAYGLEKKLTVATVEAVPEVVIAALDALPVLAAKERERQARYAEARKQYEAEALHRARVQAIERERREEVEALLVEARAWSEAQVLSKYVDAVERSGGAISNGSALDGWIRWARSVAESRAPLSRRIEQPDSRYVPGQQNAHRHREQI